MGYRAGGLADNLKNTDRSILKCIVVGQRLGHDVSNYPNLRRRMLRNTGLNWNLVDIENIAVRVCSNTQRKNVRNLLGSGRTLEYSISGVIESLDVVAVSENY